MILVVVQKLQNFVSILATISIAIVLCSSAAKGSKLSQIEYGDLVAVEEDARIPEMNSFPLFPKERSGTSDTIAVVAAKPNADVVNDTMAVASKQIHSEVIAASDSVPVPVPAFLIQNDNKEESDNSDASWIRQPKVIVPMALGIIAIILLIVLVSYKLKRAKRVERKPSLVGTIDSLYTGQQRVSDVTIFTTIV